MQRIRSVVGATWLCALFCVGCSNATGASERSPVHAVAVTPAAAVAAPAEPEEPAAPKSAAPGPASPQNLAAIKQCAEICARSTQLKCAHASECEALCIDSLESATCMPQMKSATDCMLAKPIASWQCSEDGVAAIKPGICDAEQQAFVSCVGPHAR